MITKLSSTFWETVVAYKGGNKLILRDYDLIKLRDEGKTIGQIAIKFSISERQVNNILKKYR